MPSYNKQRSSTAIFTFIIFSCIISFSIYRCNVNNQNEINEKKASEEKAKKEYNDFLNKYNFDVTDLFQIIEKCEVGNIKEQKPLSPIIIYYQSSIDYKPIFEYSMNKQIDSKYKSFNKDSIKTIVLLRDNLINVGRYSGSSHSIAYKQQIIISFIDINTKKEIYFDTLNGGNPPETIKSRRQIDDTITGSYPKYIEILETIKKNISIHPNN